MESIFDIAKRPVTIAKVHESVYRASGILEWVKDALLHNVPGHVVLEIVADIEAQPHVEYATVEEIGKPTVRAL